MGPLYPPTSDRLKDDNFFSHLSKLSAADVKGFTMLKNLWIKENSLSTLDRETLCQMPELRTLDLTNNSISKLSADLFSCLSELRSLYIGGNVITSIQPGAFAGLDRLKFLKLRGNQLLELSWGIFNNLTSLSHLDVSSNRINSIGPQTFAIQPTTNSLFYLGIQDNQLKVTFYYFLNGDGE